MAYTKQTWDTTSYVNPTRMNHIEDGIKAVSDDSGKVTQVPTVNTDDKGYRILVSKTNDNNQELGFARKAIGFTFYPISAYTALIRQHTGTSTEQTAFAIGNNVADGNTGATYGTLRLFGKGSYYGQFTDANNALTNDRTYALPNKNGTLALTSDITNTIPECNKTANGTYTLQCTVNNGVKTYSWV